MGNVDVASVSTSCRSVSARSRSRRSIATPAETMDVTQGKCRVKIAEQSDWREYQAGDSFQVPANSHFEVEVTELFDYVCHFH